MSIEHDFNECLEQSHAASDMPFWEQTYKEAFPDMVCMVDHRQDGDHQRQGIDRSITRVNGKQILIDEKVRFRNKATGKVYDDIALEYLSSTKTGALGWVCKSILSDYIAYAIAPLGKCYLLPVLQLQSAWLKNRQQWQLNADNNEAGFRIITAANRGYSTMSLVLPVNSLFKAIGNCLRVNFTPYDPPSEVQGAGTIAKPGPKQIVRESIITRWDNAF